MTKNEILKKINEMKDNEVMVLNETLSIGIPNTCRAECSKETLISLIDENFNDDLYGSFGDGVMTTIDSCEIEEKER